MKIVDLVVIEYWNLPCLMVDITIFCPHRGDAWITELGFLSFVRYLSSYPSRAVVHDHVLTSGTIRNGFVFVSSCNGSVGSIILYALSRALSRMLCLRYLLGALSIQDAGSAWLSRSPGTGAMGFPPQ